MRYNIFQGNYHEYIDLYNEAAKLNGFPDASMMKVDPYESKTFIQEMEDTWQVEHWEKFAYHALTQWRSDNLSVELHSLFSVATVYCRDKMRPQMGLFVTSRQPTVGILNQFEFDIWDRVRFLSQFSDTFVLIL